MRRYLAIAAAAFIAPACYGVTSEIAPIGGGWSIETQTAHGSEPSVSAHRLLRRKTVVADWVNRYRVFAPECVVYHINSGAGAWMAACADRAPIQLPEWVLEVRDDGPWGGCVLTTLPDGRTVEHWSRLPLDRVIQTAQAQPALFRFFGWRRPVSTPVFERVYVDVIVTRDKSLSER